jgi:septum formation protein
MTSSSNPLIWLASASPRRSALLRQIGVMHRIRPVDVDERIRPGEPPAQYVRRLAIAKAERLWSMLEESERSPVLGADTAVALADEVLGKPEGRLDAIRMLRRLSGQTHQVYTAVAIRNAQGCDALVNVSDVTMRVVDEQEIAAYWDTGEPADKAGAYGIQGMAAMFVERIAGSYSGIVGLPLFETGQLLRNLGWTPAMKAGQIGVEA